MSNPWEKVDLDTYEKHMSDSNVLQLQTLNRLMKLQLEEHDASSVMILGVAGGNGLEHIDTHKYTLVYGVDVNSSYLDECVSRYPELKDAFVPLCADLLDEKTVLPSAQLVVANLVIEFIGCRCFAFAIKKVNPDYISAVVQINTLDGFIASTQYAQKLDCISEVHRDIDPAELTAALEKIGYERTGCDETMVPGGKTLMRLSYRKI